MPDTDRLVPLNAPSRVGLEREIRSLRCKLTPSERLAKSEVLARHLQTLEKMEWSHKAAKAEMKSEEDDQKHLVKDVAHDVRTGTEARDTECEWVADFETNRLELVRLDTGETVQSQELPDSKRQLALKIVDA